MSRVPVVLVGNACMSRVPVVGTFTYCVHRQLWVFVVPFNVYNAFFLERLRCFYLYFLETIHIGPTILLLVKRVFIFFILVLLKGKCRENFNACFSFS